ncbi:MAG: Ca-activated chloride channel [Bacteroidota bacterium]|nr:Ca-activated chloride channel [Bacteroidota bacterium]
MKDYPEIKRFAVLLILLCFLIPAIISCGSTQPSLLRTSSEIFQGQSANLSWAFNDADSVKVSTHDEVFAASDSVRVSPDVTTTYKITAYMYYDSSEIYWQVNVMKPIELKKTQKGPEILHPETLTQSDNKSEYLKGITQLSDDNSPFTLRITKILYPPEGSSLYKMQSVILDRYGNFVSGLQGSADWKLNIFNQCTDLADRIDNCKFKEGVEESKRKNLDICVLFDNSAPAEQNNSVIKNAKNLFTKFNTNYNLSFAYFNENYFPIVPITGIEKALWQFKNAEIPWAYGLNALYKALFNGIVELQSKRSGNMKLLIAVVYGYDNASILYQESDIIELSRKYNIPIYIIGIGKSVESYSLKHISSASGGRFYHVPDEKGLDINDLFNEIIYSQNLNYEYEFFLGEQLLYCPEFYSTVKVQGGSSSAVDKIYVLKEPEPLLSRYQSLACFKENESGVEEEYMDNLSKLAEVLLRNKEFGIELIGNCSMSETYANKSELASRRAKAVKDILIAKGVLESQIITRSDAANSPVYYFEESPWQKFYNRRAEIRWLAPELLPFEIIADISPTETEASEKVEHWQDQGYRAYYDRYIINGLPVYRIKLWGYKTYNEAEDVANLLEKKYKSQFKVE